jgi:hypothetical protein
LSHFPNQKRAGELHFLAQPTRPACPGLPWGLPWGVPWVPSALNVDRTAILRPFSLDP